MEVDPRNFIKRENGSKCDPGTRTYNFKYAKNVFVGFTISKDLESKLLHGVDRKWMLYRLEDTYLFRKLFSEFNKTGTPIEQFRTWLDTYDFSTIRDKYDIASMSDLSVKLVEMVTEHLFQPSDYSDSPSYVSIDSDFTPTTPEHVEDTKESEPTIEVSANSGILTSSTDSVDDLKELDTKFKEHGLGKSWVEQLDDEASPDNESSQQIVFTVDPELQIKFSNQPNLDSSNLSINNVGTNNPMKRFVITNNIDLLSSARSRTVVVLPTVEQLKMHGLYSTNYYQRLRAIVDRLRSYVLIDQNGDTLGKFKMKRVITINIRSCG